MDLNRLGNGKKLLEKVMKTQGSANMKPKTQHQQKNIHTAKTRKK